MKLSRLKLLSVAVMLLMLHAITAQAQSMSPAEWSAAAKKVNASEVPKEKTAGEQRQRDEAGAMLHKTVEAMKTGVWNVNANIQARESAPLTGKWGAWKPHEVIKGVFSGENYDLIGSNSNTRRIGVDGKSWSSVDGGKTWEDGEKGIPITFYSLDMLRHMSQWENLKCEPLGREQHPDGEWLHVRTAGPTSTSVDYWLLLDAKGEPVMVRKAETIFVDGFINATRQHSYLYTVEISPANSDARISAPENAPK